MELSVGAGLPGRPASTSGARVFGWRLADRGGTGQVATDMEPSDLGDPDRLREGSPAQRRAAGALSRFEVFGRLSSHDPVLAGSVPLCIQVADSDLDVLCRADDPARFGRLLRSCFGTAPDFSVRRVVREGRPTVIGRFRAEPFPVEIFGQPVASRRQTAFLHLRAEARLLEAAGEPAREAIRDLKRDGWDTEPAFARHFGLEGDPYLILRELASASPRRIRRIAERGS